MNAPIKPPVSSAADEYGPFMRGTYGAELAMTKEQQMAETQSWLKRSEDLYARRYADDFAKDVSEYDAERGRTSNLFWEAL